MIERILRISIYQRGLVLIAVLGMAMLGIYSYQNLPIDAVPDITNVQVQINTQAPGYSPMEAEQRVTFPIETIMAGLPQPALYPLHLALWAFSGHGYFRGRHGYLLRPAVGDQRIQEAREQAACRCRANNGADLYRPRRDIHVDRQCREEDARKRMAQPYNTDRSA